jgi:lipoate-protein ligase A
VPEAKLAKRALDSAAQRVVTLTELLGQAPSIPTIQEALVAGFAQRLGITPVPGDITAHEEALAARCHEEEIGTDAFVAEIDDPAADAGVREGSHTGPGGTVSAFVRLEGPRGERIREVLITGDFFVTPPRTVFDLEARLRNVPVTDVGAAVERFFAEANVGLLSVSPADFRAAIEAALAPSL